MSEDVYMKGTVFQVDFLFELPFYFMIYMTIWRENVP